LGKNEDAWKEQFISLAGNTELNREMGEGEEGNIRFDIKMNVILAKKLAEGGQP
jgi:hypothetical protein